jgi:hypothetical protein
MFSGGMCPQYLFLRYRRILVLWRSGRRIPTVHQVSTNFFASVDHPQKQSITSIKKQTFAVAKTFPARLRSCPPLHVIPHHRSLLGLLKAFLVT